jgi:hypothetical protein
MMMGFSFHRRLSDKPADKAAPFFLIVKKKEAAFLSLLCYFYT